MRLNRRLVISICALLSLVAFSKDSQAGKSNKSESFSYTAAGTFDGPLDATFPDGNPVFSITLQGTSTFGPVTVHEWAASPTEGASCTLPGGVAGTQFSYADSYEVITFTATDEFLIQDLVSGSQCISDSGPPIPFNGTLTVTNVGGTGRFARATGQGTVNFGGQYLFLENGTVGYVQHKESGTLITP